MRNRPSFMIYRDFENVHFWLFLLQTNVSNHGTFAENWIGNLQANPRTIESGYWQKQMTRKKLHISKFNYMGLYDMKYYILKYTQCSMPVHQTNTHTNISHKSKLYFVWIGSGVEEAGEETKFLTHSLFHYMKLYNLQKCGRSKGRIYLYFRRKTKQTKSPRTRSVEKNLFCPQNYYIYLLNSIFR